MKSEICGKCGSIKHPRSNGRFYCRRCQNAVTRKWRDDNRDIILVKRKDYYKKNLDKVMEWHRTKKHPLRGIYGTMIQRCTNPNNAKYKYYGGRGVKVCERWRGPEGFSNFTEDMGQRPSPRHSIDRYPDNRGNYEPSNVRWATQTEQMWNLRTNIKSKLELPDTTEVTYRGETMALLKFSDITRIDLRVVKYRFVDAEILNLDREEGDSVADYILNPYAKRPTHFYNGVDYSQKELEIISGINNTVIGFRIKLGWSVERALTTPVKRSTVFSG